MNEEKKYSWISVADALPEHEQEVLACHKKGSMHVLVFVDTEKLHRTLQERGIKPAEDFSAYSFSSIESYGMCLKDILYWMPLPKLPERLVN